MKTPTLVKIGLIILALILLAVSAWQAGNWLKASPATHVPAETVVQHPVESSTILAEGRVEFYPGARVTVSSEVAGLLTNIVVREKSRVQLGDLLAEIQADDVYASLMEARARAAEIESEIRLAKLELDRGKSLSGSGALTPQELDRLTLKLDFLQTRQVTAGAMVKRQETTLAKTRLCAPIDGVVLERYIHAGEIVNAGTPIVALGDLQRSRIEADVDEYFTGRIQLGTPLRIRVEGCSEVWPGKVEEIPDAVSHRILQPQDPAQPSDVRVLAVKIAFQQTNSLKLGQRVEVEIPAR